MSPPLCNEVACLNEHQALAIARRIGGSEEQLNPELRAGSAVE
jgi:hypothetical protein